MAVQFNEFDFDTFVAEQAEEASRMYIEDGVIVLDYVHPYCIELSRCDTPGKILGWINQLAGKTWMDADRLNCFAQLAFRQLGIEIDYGI
jgi:hypothetical protein